jgi:hypothetical protein
MKRLGGTGNLSLRTLPQELRAVPVQGEPDPLDSRPHLSAPDVRCGGAGADRSARRDAIAMPACNNMAEALAGISHALNGLALLVGDPARPLPRRGGLRLHVPDWLPALVNAGRAFVAIGAAELFWIITAWPNGAGAITFAAIVVLLASPRADQAYANAMSFMVGVGLAAAFAAIIEFAVLPGRETFAAFSIAIGLVLVPAGALTAQPVAERAVFRNRRYRFQFAARSGESDELRYSAIL